MKKIIYIISLIVLFINIVVFGIQFNQLSFLSKLIPVLGNILLLIIGIGDIYLLFRIYRNDLKSENLFLTISIILNIILLIFNLSASIFDKTMSKITSNDTIYTSTIIVRNDSSVNSLADLNDKKIGISDNENDYENYKLGYEYLEKNNKISNNTFYKYSDYSLALSDLINGNIDALIISNNYLELYSDYFEDLNTKVKSIISSLSISVKKETTKLKNNLEPFTVLVIGADGKGGSAYNADVLILMTVNPITKNVVMVDVVRDTYAYNLGNGMMDKITHSGWYGTENVVNTVSNLFDIKIDYYVKLNFESVEELVNLIGGVTIDVPYRYVVKPKTGNYYVEPGVKKLNGIETLWLARTRKEAGSSLFTRGEMQMTIIEQIIKQTNKDILLKNYFKFTSILENNISTNISKQDLYYYIQKYTSIRDELTFSHNRLNGTDSTYYHSGMQRNLYTYKYDETSLNNLKSILKNNLVNN